MTEQMQDKMEKSTVGKFWSKYTAQLQKNGIKETAARWYVVRVEQYIKAYPERRLTSHSAKDVEAYFHRIGREKKLQSWQFYQLVHAIQILFVAIIRPDWVENFDWDYWLASAKDLESDHPTLARDNSSMEWQFKKKEDRSTAEVSEKYHNVLQQMITEIRRRHYSIRTEKTYVDWIIRYIKYHQNKDPEKMSSQEVISFLEYLAVGRNVSASTQNQALNALVFLYNQVFRKPLEDLGEFTRAKRPRKLPVVLSVPEIKRLLENIEDGTFTLMAGLLYGSGLRLMECMRLRIQDVDFDYKQIVVRDGKGQKDRVVPLPERYRNPLREHMDGVKKIHEEDLNRGFGEVFLPEKLGSQKKSIVIL